MGSVMEPGVALQLYTVRRDFARDAEDTVRRVSDAGYTAVEVAGTGDMSAADLRALLDRFNLQAMGVHASLQGLENDFESQMRDAGTLGIQYVTTAYLPPEERKNPEQLGKRLNAIGRRVREQGFTFAHHNHDFEFAEVDGQRFLDRLLASCDPENVKVELDIYWAVFAGVDPLDYLRRYSGRVPLIHLKDMAPDRTYANVGEGMLDFPQLTKAASAAGARWFIVEHDEPGPNPVEAAGTSLHNLQEMGIAR